MSNPSPTRTEQLYQRAKTLIPGGTQLLSKRPEMMLPDQWPAYYAKAKGCEIWDLDGRKFIDMTTNGIGACLLGFGDDDVDAAVKKVIDNGSMCTLNSPLEIELAELLCEIHPWAGSVRYSRSGGESMAVAVRIARAFSGKDKVCFCGYHGWTDWYISANLAGDKQLDGHLIPGIAPAGVPRGLVGTALPFKYNRIDELKAHVDKHKGEIGAIVMEPMRSEMPKDGFLHQVREIANSIGAVLVFDEVTAGWRNNFGGVHLLLGVEPDIAVFAKATSNGYPMGAIIGKSNVMQAAQTSFISSTYWTESIGPAAAIATIRKMKNIQVWEITTRNGRQVQDGYRRLLDKHGIQGAPGGSLPLSTLAFSYGEQSQAVRTLFTQLMLERGYLASSGYYATAAHTPQIIDGYLAAIDEAFPIIRKAIDNNDVRAQLRGPVAHAGFQRLA
jgi:glutamate-1-semialdehyde aminotransferase